MVRVCCGVGVLSSSIIITHPQHTSELAVGNMVRRVLHIIREEAQTESMERKLEKQDTSQIDKHKIQGLLTRALKQTFSQRNFSLTNLLDRDLFDASTFGTGGGGGEGVVWCLSVCFAFG